MPVETSPCSTATCSRAPQQICPWRAAKPHPYYWNLARPCNSWFEIHFHRRNIPEEFFYRQMRMSRDTFDTLLVTLRHKLQREDTRLRNCIPPEKVLAIGLHRLAHGGSFENAGIAMNVGKATAREAFTDVVIALYDFRNDFVKFPANEVETRASIEALEELSDLPNITGAIDGTHIKIKAPKESAVDYFSRYQQHDGAVQGIVGGKKIFMDIAAGFPGSLHDARVPRNSSIYDRAEHGDVPAAPIHVIGGHEIQPYLVGDSAYPLSRWLQKSYPEGTTDPSEIQFNKQLTAARVKMECAFGILKSRWQSLTSTFARLCFPASRSMIINLPNTALPLAQTSRNLPLVSLELCPFFFSRLPFP